MRPCSLLLSLAATLLLADAYVRPFGLPRASLHRLESAVPSTTSDGGLSSTGDFTVESRPAVSWDWKQVAESAFEDNQRPIILFDGKCNLCNGAVNFAIDHDPDGM